MECTTYCLVPDQRSKQHNSHILYVVGITEVAYFNRLKWVCSFGFGGLTAEAEKPGPNQAFTAFHELGVQVWG